MFAEETATKSPLLIAFHNPAGDLLIHIKISIKTSIRNPLRGLSAFIIRVFDLHQLQPMRRSCLGRRTAILRRQNFRYLLRFYQSAAYPKQCSGNDADHIVKKTISTNAKHDLITGLFNIKAAKTA